MSTTVLIASGEFGEAWRGSLVRFPDVGSVSRSQQVQPDIRQKLHFEVAQSDLQPAYISRCCGINSVGQTHMNLGGLAVVFLRLHRLPGRAKEHICTTDRGIFRHLSHITKEFEVHTARKYSKMNSRDAPWGVRHRILSHEGIKGRNGHKPTIFLTHVPD